jgi:hypothetical protein
MNESNVLRDTDTTWCGPTDTTGAGCVACGGPATAGQAAGSWWGSIVEWYCRARLSPLLLTKVAALTHSERRRRFAPASAPQIRGGHAYWPAISDCGTDTAASRRTAPRPLYGRLRPYPGVRQRRA